jgi:hypothetical protein
MDAKHIANGVLAKDSPIGQFKTTILPSVMDFTLQDALSKKYLARMMAAGTKE